MVGTRIGHYQIVKSLGKGGMGEVFAAEDSRLELVEGRTLDGLIPPGGLPLDRVGRCPRVRAAVRIACARVAQLSAD